ncbi:hypothetical protein NP493_251g03006 [Ridgeia piscesae]|uniref:phosphatidylinositol-3,4-bisphosphate 4-phosphatase n=1 Tax=Ridgeia piscesae TaxID=27915 RepID=A0AAD9UD19_RIDPI|nr:hypothetical protein NP493_251g03006 [Ridgeia piscesae]
MRFNSRELAALAQQDKNKFDKEGVLLIKERQEGIFRKGESYVERLFRLRGNLLFYFKTKEPQSEVIGLFVMERYVVELDSEEEIPYSFVLVFEGVERVIQLAAGGERERDRWIESLHIASYECMKMQLESLREQLWQRTGRDPIDNPEPTELPSTCTEEGSETNEPLLEMCVSCDGLPCETNGQQPNTFVSVAVLTPPEQDWSAHAHTEIIERNANPCYLTTVSFVDTHTVTLSMRLKLVVYNVKERMTNTMAQIGCVLFTIKDLLTTPGYRLRLPLNSLDLQDKGNVTVMAWHNGPQLEWQGLEMTGSIQTEVLGADSSVVNAALPLPSRNVTKRVDMLRPLYDHIITRTYRFPTNSGEELSTYEYLGESKLTFLLPVQLLKLWVSEEKDRLKQLQELGELKSKLEVTRNRLMQNASDTVKRYTSMHSGYLRLTGAPFKPSVKKSHKEVEFAPTNLHLQRMWVHNEDKEKYKFVDIVPGACYDVMTFGAFTAFTQKYKHGGLRRQLRHSADGCTTLMSVTALLNRISAMRTAVNSYCEAVCRAAIHADSADLNNSSAALVDKTRQLIQVCEDPLVERGMTSWHRNRLQKATSADPQARLTNHVAPSGGGGLSEESWKWSGTDFVKSPTEEPWEMTRLNTEASLVCVMSEVELLLQGGCDSADHRSTKWLEALSPHVIKLQSCVEVTCQRARSCLSFISVQESGSNVALMHSIKYRRDVVFAQALTCATTAVMTKLRRSMTDEVFLRQLFQIGVLLEFESLVSCYGDEMGMLEDMEVGVTDLSHVVFKVTQASKPDDVMPVVTGSRSGYIVHLPVPEHMFLLLPRELQQGHAIKVIPVIFSIGINEQATIAERFGDMSVQEAVNIDSYKRLYAYYEKFVEIIGEPEGDKTSAMSLEQLIRHLHINVMSKKNKNVEVLHLAAEVCRALNGVRLTSCKSGKDRTAMSVTLEQVQLLQREHDLASHVFMHALACMRSEGVRRENAQKNTGSRKYAFNSLQLLSMPRLYRPPNGTYGNVQS